MYEREQSQSTPDMGNGGTDVVLSVRFVGMERTDNNERSYDHGASLPTPSLVHRVWGKYRKIVTDWWQAFIIAIVLIIACLSYAAQIPQIPDFPVETRVLEEGAPP